MNVEFYRNICRDMVLFWIFATISLCLGLFLNQVRDKPLSLVYKTKVERLQVDVATISTTQKVQFVSSILAPSLSLDEFHAFVEQKRGLVLDARPEIFHRLGHIPGAISFPREDFESSYVKFRTQLEADKSQPITVYCSGDSCKDSGLVQQALVNLGYSHVSVFNGGWSEWTSAGLPQEKTP